MHRTAGPLVLLIAPWRRRRAAVAVGRRFRSFIVRYDQLLDVNVRDGLVYYRALRGERGRLDRYVASLNVPAATYQGWSREDKIAFWLNGYNAIVLQTVITTIRSAASPPSIRRRASGRSRACSRPPSTGWPAAR